MNKKNKLLQRLGIVMLLMLTLCFGFVPDAKAAAAKDATVEASIASTPISKAAPAPYLTTTTMTFDKGSGSKTTQLMYGSVKSLKKSASWITISNSGSTITVKVSTNSASSTRTGKATVVLTTGKELTISVTQYGMIRVLYGGSYISSVTMPGVYSLNLPTATVDRKVTAESVAAITVSDSYTWISTSVVGKDIYIYLSPNYNTNERRGSISISNGVSTTSLQIIQQAFIPDPYYYSKNWTNYFDYYNWEQNIKNSSYLSSVKTAYKNLVNANFSGYITMTASGSIVIDTSKDSALLSLVRSLVNATAKIYGVSAPSVTLITAAPNLCGQYIMGANRIEINRFQALNLVELAKTVFHEMRHKWQDVNKATNKTLVQYLLYYNFLPGKYIKSGSNYELQVVERDAFYVEERMYQIVK